MNSQARWVFCDRQKIEPTKEQSKQATKWEGNEEDPKETKGDREKGRTEVCERLDGATQFHANSLKLRLGRFNFSSWLYQLYTSATFLLMLNRIPTNGYYKFKGTFRIDKSFNIINFGYGIAHGTKHCMLTVHRARITFTIWRSFEIARGLFVFFFFWNLLYFWRHNGLC